MKPMETVLFARSRHGNVSSRFQGLLVVETEGGVNLRLQLQQHFSLLVLVGPCVWTWAV